METWRVVAASAIGTSHVAAGTKCQDASGFDVLDLVDQTVLISAVSDGAGSAKHSDIGAQSTIATIKRQIGEYFEQGGTFDGLSREVAACWLESVLQVLREQANEHAAPLAEFACTLLFAIIGDQHAAFFQLGDGAIVASDGVSDGFSYVFWPQHGEFANTTNFVVSRDALNLFEFEVNARPQLKEVAIFSDGLENLVLHNATRTVHEAFFSTMFEPLRACNSPDQGKELASDLEKYLMSSRVCDRTDDDKSLVLATRVAI